MRMEIHYGNKKAQGNLLKLPPLLRRRLYTLRYFGGAVSAAIKYRVGKKGIGSDDAKIDKFTNTGGMWSGIRSRIAGKNAVIDFGATSFPSAYERFLRTNFKTEAKRKAYLKSLAKEDKLKKISNRLKAVTAGESKSAGTRNPLGPSRSEIRALFTWMEEHLEQGTLSFKGSNNEKRAVPDRFDQILKRLPNPKNK
tara:strand:- start:67 stop:654 length:588 start_codon:yes stop_codon:yes gene_type:complete